MDAPRLPRRKRVRWRSVARLLARLLAGSVVVLLAVPVLLLGALRLSSARAVLAKEVDGALAGLFRGRLHVREVRRVDLGGVSASGTVDDAAGHEVLRFEGVTAQLSVPRLLWELARGHGVPEAIVFEVVRLEHAEVRLIDDGTGVPTLAAAFDPRTKGAPGGEPAPRVLIRRIELGHAWVHGRLGTAPLIDADVSALGASLALERTAFQLEVASGRLTARLAPYSLDPAGSIEGRLHVPLGPGALDAQLRFRGTVAGTQASARASLSGQKVAAEAELPAVASSVLHRFVPDLELRGTARLRATADGTFDALTLAALADGDFGHVEARGTLGTSPVRALAKIELAGFDASAVVLDSPRTRVDAQVDLSLALRGEGTGVALDGKAMLREPGFTTALRYRLKTATNSGELWLAARAELADPPRLRELARVSVHGVLAAKGELHWPEPSLELEAEADLTSVSHPTVTLGATHVELTAAGALARPRFKASVASRNVRAFGRQFPSALLTLAGTRRELLAHARLHGPHEETLAAGSVVRLLSGSVELAETSLAYRDRQGALAVSAGRARFTADAGEVERLIFDGAGHAAGSLAWRGKNLRFEAKARALDVLRLARLAEVSVPVRSLRATLEASYERVSGVSSGAFQGSLSNITYGHVSEGSAAFNLSLADDELSGTLDTELVPGSHVVFGFDDLALEIPREAELWLPRGRIRVAGKLDLTCITPLIAALPGLPVEDAKGTVDLQVAYAHGANGELPELTASVHTHDLALIGKRAGTRAIDTTSEAIEAAPVIYRGVDFGLDLALDAPTRSVVAHAGFYDARGELLKLDATSGPWPGGPLGAAFGRARDVPLELEARMPSRRLTSLPGPIRTRSLRGMVSGELHVDGTLADPHVTVDARAARLGTASERIQGQERPKVDVLAHVDYRHERGELELGAMRGRARAVDVAASWSGDILRAATEPEERRSFSYHAEAKLDALDLETVPALKNRQIEGVLSGFARVDYGPAGRSLDADLSAHPLRVGQATMDQVNIAIAADQRQVTSAVSVSGQSGSLDARLASGLTWPAEGVPSLAGTLRTTLSARQFRLAALWPLVGDSVNEIDGRLDAELSAQVDDERVLLRGHGRLREGVMQIPAVGQRFEAISADIEVAPESVVLKDVRARGLTGGLTGSARITLDRHLGLEEASGTLVVGKHQKVPVTVEGVALGDAWGTVEARAVKKGERLELLVRVPELHVDVPDTGSNDVQELSRDRQVRVGVRRSDATFVALPVQPLSKPPEPTTPLDLTLELGDSVWLERGDQVSAQVSGRLVVAVREETSVNGEIALKGGTLDVSGKRFELERGTVTFSGGDPADPSISAVARWDAPAGYAVYATYAGSVRKGKLTLRAEPPLSEDEILNLILFGTPEGTVSSGTGDSASGAIGIAGGTATRGINRAISDFTKLDVQARVDTSSGDARPELVIPLSRRLSARLTRAIGEPSAGASPDRTFLTLELRLRQKWALSALLGDRGASSLDLVWRSHY